MSTGKILVLDVGTSSVRASIVTDSGSVSDVVQHALLPTTPDPGIVEFDAQLIWDRTFDAARELLQRHGRVDAVGITNQRATTVVWNATTGKALGPVLGWQDLRTVINCLLLQGEGLRLAPNASATKLQWLLDTYDPDRTQQNSLRFGTIDSWLIWNLSQGALHVTDATNAGVTGLLNVATEEWDREILKILNVPFTMMPRIVDSSGVLGEATALEGAPPIAGVAGDQQASLLGQSCVRPGIAKITFGTGGMLDMVTGPVAPASALRSEAGTFPIAAWRFGGTITWGLEAIMLAAGSCVEWLRDDLGLVSSAEATEELAAQCTTSEGVVFVPALLGLGTPTWDFGARGLLLGLTRGSGRAQITRAVLEGVAQRGRDLVDAAEADARVPIETVRVDGGMSANGVFVRALANALNRPIELSPVLEATTLGAGFLAGLGVGIWSGLDDLAALWLPRDVIHPDEDEQSRLAQRAQFLEARSRSERTIPDLSGISF